MFCASNLFRFWRFFCGMEIGYLQWKPITNFSPTALHGQYALYNYKATKEITYGDWQGERHIETDKGDIEYIGNNV